MQRSVPWAMQSDKRPSPHDNEISSKLKVLAEEPDVGAGFLFRLCEASHPRYRIQLLRTEVLIHSITDELYANDGFFG